MNIQTNDLDRDSIIQVLMMIESTTEDDYARRKESSLRAQLDAYPVDRINDSIDRLAEAGVLDIAEDEDDYASDLKAARAQFHLDDAEIKPANKPEPLTTTFTVEISDQASDRASDKPAGKSMSAKAAALQKALADLIEAPTAELNESEVIRLIKAEIAKLRIPTAQVLEIKKHADAVPESLGLVHASLADLVIAATARVNVFLVGPAGSGKTTAASQVATALGLPFYFNGAISSEYKLMGFIDAQGRLVSTAFREAYENGGVYLFDEVDASLPAATMAFNAALSNGFCDFPEGRVDKHPDFVCLAAGNTYGGGATFDFVGRNKQDGAFMDRFVVLDWPLDAALESSTTPNAEWTAYVQSVRGKAARQGLKVIISPRASYNGAKLLAAGMSRDKVIAMTLQKGMTPDQWASIK